MEKITITAIDRSGFAARIIYIELMAEDKMTDDDVIKAIELACQEYYGLDKKEYSGRYEDFSYDDFKQYVPNTICRKYGILKIEEDAHQIEVVDNEIIFEEELEEDYYW